MAGQVDDGQGASVDGEHVDDADRGGAEEAREQQRRPSDRAHDERLQQSPLRVSETTPSVRKTASTTPRKSVANIASPSRKAPANVRVSTLTSAGGVIVDSRVKT